MSSIRYSRNFWDTDDWLDGEEYFNALKSEQPSRKPYETPTMTPRKPAEPQQAPATTLCTSCKTRETSDSNGLCIQCWADSPEAYCPDCFRQMRSCRC